MSQHEKWDLECGSMNKTLEYYNSHAKEYAASTVNTDMSHLYEVFESYLPVGGSVLDLGCGSGRDSKHFLETGYTVEATDGSEELCKEASTLLGIEVKHKLFEEVDYEDAFDGIWACASLLHVKREDIYQLVVRILKGLKSNGVFFTCFKYGNEEYIDDKGRYFNCYTEETVKELFKDVNILKIWTTEDAVGNRQQKWVNVLVKRVDN